MEKINAHQRYRDDLAEDIKNIPKNSEVLVDGEPVNERLALLNSEKGVRRYEKAYEVHRKALKEYCVTRIGEKIEDLNLEIGRLTQIQNGYLQELSASETTTETDVNPGGKVAALPESENADKAEEETVDDSVSILDVERELDQAGRKGCVLEEGADEADVRFVLASKTLEEFKIRFKNLIDDLFVKNDLNNTSFSRKLSPEKDEQYHKMFRSLVSRTISLDRPVSIQSLMQRDIFRGLGLNIVDFAAKVEYLEVKEKLDYDINEDFFSPDKVVLNEFVKSLTEDDDVNFSKLLALLHDMDNKQMQLEEIEGCVLKIKPTKKQVLEVLTAETLDDFNKRLSDFVKNILEINNITTPIFAEETDNDPSLVHNVRSGLRPISTNSVMHKKMFTGLGLDIKIFESRQRKLINDKKHGIKNLENFKYSDVNIKPYIAILSEKFTNLSVGDLVRVAHFIDSNFEMVEKNKNVFAEMIKNEFPELVIAK